MAPFWGMLALMLSVLLVVCAGIAYVHYQILHVSWFRAFEVIMAEAGVAILTSIIIHKTEFQIARIFRNDNDTTQILRSYDCALELITYFDVALACVLVFLEVFGQFVRI